jgi:hypothetical protein
MTVADDHLARIDSALDQWDREVVGLSVCDPLHDLDEVSWALAEALQPVIAITIKLGVGPAPGSDPEEDAMWMASVALARRDVLAGQTGGIDSGLTTDNLRLLERVDALIGIRNDTDWQQLVRQRVSELVEARKRGRQRGMELRQLRESDPGSEPPEQPTVGWLLRHPTDYWLRQAAPTVADAVCRSLIEAQIARLAPTYQLLCELDWTAEEAAADVICEVQAFDAKSGASKEPVRATVTRPVKGAIRLDQQIPLRVVRDPDGPFNGKLVSVLAGERWLICARQLGDSALLPLDGTRRRAATTA